MCSLKGSLIRHAEVLAEVVEERAVSIEHAAHLVMDVVDTQAIIHELDYAAIVPSRQDFVRVKPQLQVGSLEELVHQRDELHSEFFKAEIVSTLHDQSCKLPGL